MDVCKDCKRPIFPARPLEECCPGPTQCRIDRENGGYKIESGDIAYNAFRDLDTGRLAYGGERCLHATVRLWRLPANDQRVSSLLQWCVSCGGTRIIEGTKIHFWHLPHGMK